jgi:hypothetical protein
MNELQKTTTGETQSRNRHHIHHAAKDERTRTSNIRTGKKETDADRRIYTLTATGISFLKEGVETVKSHRGLKEKLVLFYDATFLNEKKAGDDI